MKKKQMAPRKKDIAAANLGPRSRVWTLDTVKSRCVVRGACWVWTQSVIAGTGRPQARINGCAQAVQPWVLEQVLGRRIKARHCAVATCGESRCCSPECLSEVSASEVMRNQWRSGVRGGAEWIELQRQAIKRRGIQKIPDEVANEIRYQVLQVPEKKVLAERFGVTIDTLNRCSRGESHAPRQAANSVFAWRPAA